MTEREAIAYIEQWDVTEAAKVIKWYEDNELLRPCDCDTMIAIETESLRDENAKLREYATKAWSLFIRHGAVHECDLSEVDAVRDGLRELGVEVDS